MQLQAQVRLIKTLQPDNDDPSDNSDVGGGDFENTYAVLRRKAARSLAEMTFATRQCPLQEEFLSRLRHPFPSPWTA